MNKFDKQRIENAIWVLLQYEYELVDLVGFLEDRLSYEMKDAISLLKDVQEELNRK